LSIRPGSKTPPAQIREGNKAERRAFKAFDVAVTQRRCFNQQVAFPAIAIA